MRQGGSPLLSPGTQLGQFEITGTLGAGGMGEVYRARDTKLGREVAIKVLPEDFAQNAERLARFEREAKILASLNHSNIGALHDFQQEGEVRFLVLELVEGETLADRIDRGPVSVKETIPLFIQIAEALEAAHESGIIHRDLKPANIKITPEGKVKVLDFGMAKPIETARPLSPTDETAVGALRGAPSSPTAPTKVTTDGTILGTPSYMSPEQARGEEVDKRTDIWAFGCCLYETLTGRPPFDGDTTSHLIVSILEDELDWNLLPPALPDTVSNLLRRCFEKETRKRLKDAGDIAITLEEAYEALKRDSQKLRPESLAKRQAATPSMGRLAMAAGLILAVVGIGTALWITRGEQAPNESTPLVESASAIRSLAVLPFDNLTNDPSQDIFAGGLTFLVTMELAKIRALKVISNTTAIRYKDSDLSIPEIAGELRVDGVITGSMQREGDEVDISVQLIHGLSDTYVWSESYTYTVTSIMKLQSAVALAVADAVGAELTGDERRRIATTHDVNPRAYEAYIIGAHYLNDITTEGLYTAIRYFEKAAEIDPDYAHAWGGMVCAYWQVAAAGLAEPREIFPKARAAGLRALQLNDDMSTDQSHMGMILMGYDHEWEQAEERFKYSIELSPSDSTGHADYAEFLKLVGRTGEALEHAAASLELDPKPTVYNLYIALESKYLESDPERVRRNMERLLAEKPELLQTLETLTLAHKYLGSREEAIATAEKWVGRASDDTSALTNLALALADGGQTERAQGVLEKIDAIKGYFDSAAVGYAYVPLDDLDKAFEWLEKGYDSRDWGMTRLRTIPYWKIYLDDPSWIRFRSDPRYRDLVGRVNFPPLPPGHPGYEEEQSWLARRASADKPDTNL